MMEPVVKGYQAFGICEGLWYIRMRDEYMLPHWGLAN